MKLIKTIEKNIDRVNDGVQFKMTLFSEGKYDREHLRTIVKNVGVKIQIENELPEPLMVKNLYLGVVIQNKLVTLYSSSSLLDLFPLSFYPGEILTYYFYGYDLKDKLSSFKDEEGVFILSSDNDTLHSARFDGDLLEREILILEDGESANWGSNKYHIFDIESNF